MEQINRKEIERKKRIRRMPFMYFIIAASLLITAISGFSEAQNRIFRHYTEDGNTSFTQVWPTNKTNITYNAINGDNPECEFQVGDNNSGVWTCMNRTNYYTCTGNTCTAVSGSGGAPTGATYVTLSNDGTLTAERVLTAGAGITTTDTGANGIIRINVTGTVCATGNYSYFNGSEFLCRDDTSGSGGSGITSLTAGTGINLTPNPITTTGNVSIINLQACNAVTEYSVWNGSHWLCDNDGTGSDTNNYTNNISFSQNGTLYTLTLSREGMTDLTSNFTVNATGNISGAITASYLTMGTITGTIANSMIYQSTAEYIFENNTDNFFFQGFKVSADSSKVRGGYSLDFGSDTRQQGVFWYKNGTFDAFFGRPYNSGSSSNYLGAGRAESIGGMGLLYDLDSHTFYLRSNSTSGPLVFNLFSNDTAGDGSGAYARASINFYANNTSSILSRLMSISCHEGDNLTDRCIFYSSLSNDTDGGAKAFEWFVQEDANGIFYLRQLNNIEFPDESSAVNTSQKSGLRFLGATAKIHIDQNGNDTGESFYIEYDTTPKELFRVNTTGGYLNESGTYSRICTASNGQCTGGSGNVTGLDTNVSGSVLTTRINNSDGTYVQDTVTLPSGSGNVTSAEVNVSGTTRTIRINNSDSTYVQNTWTESSSSFTYSDYFNQNLNTTNNVTFKNITTQNVTINNKLLLGNQKIYDAFNFTTGLDWTSGNSNMWNTTGLVLYLGNNTTYMIRCDFINRAAAATTGVKVRVNTTGSPISANWVYTSMSSATAMESFSGTSTSSNEFVDTGSTTVDHVATIAGFVQTGASTSVFTIDMATEINASIARVKPGSNCRAIAAVGIGVLY